jgi:hypothetical protein
MYEFAKLKGRQPMPDRMTLSLCHVLHPPSLLLGDGLAVANLKAERKHMQLSNSFKEQQLELELKASQHLKMRTSSKP